MSDRPSADRTAELLFWYCRKPSRYQAEGRRRDAPRLDPDVVLRLALARPVEFADASWKESQKQVPLQEAAAAYVRHMFFRPDATPYQTLGLEPGASVQAIKESFRLLMQLVHPDRQGARKIWPDACAAQANSAYAILRDQDTRRTFEEEAEARATLARAIYRAASAAEASRMPTITWTEPPLKGKRALHRPALPEWLTAGVGGYARKNPAMTAFGVLITVAIVIVGTTFFDGQQGLLVRVARESPTPTATASPNAGAQAIAASDAHAAEAVEPGPARRPSPPAERSLMVASASTGVASDATSGARMSEPAMREIPVNASAAAPSMTEPAVAAVASASPIVAPSASAVVPGTVGPPPVELPAAPATATIAAESVAVPRAPTPPAIIPAVAPVVARADANGASPEASRAANVADAAASLPPAGNEIEALFATFVDSYERGRLDAFTALFDDDAYTNLRRGRAAIRGEYDELFRLSQWRRMQLTHVNWKRVGDRAVAKGEITVKIGWRDGREVEQRLNVDVELMRRDGRVVIARLSHQPKAP